MRGRCGGEGGVSADLTKPYIGGEILGSGAGGAAAACWFGEGKAVVGGAAEEAVGVNAGLTKPHIGGAILDSGAGRAAAACWFG